jgi:hypothetical protein
MTMGFIASDYPNEKESRQTFWQGPKCKRTNKKQINALFLLKEAEKRGGKNKSSATEVVVVLDTSTKK